MTSMAAVVQGTERWHVQHADCRFALSCLPDACVDAIVCDPPYDLTAGKKGGTGVASLNLNSPAGRARISTGFMGKAWDGTGIAFDPAMWAEALRVLKPGGHLLAFGGTRTYHRMTCAIEDAGFDVRDCLAYMYGTGFPKSLNVHESARGLYCECGDSDVHGVRGSVRDASLLAQASEATEVLQGVQRSGARSSVGDVRSHGPEGEDGGVAQASGGQDAWATEPGLEGRGDVLPETRELQADPIRQMSSGASVDGPQGRIRDGASAAHGADGEAPARPRRGRAPRGPRPAEQYADESGAVARQPVTQVGGAWPTCGRCGKPRIPSGFGTALKPAFEPVVLARKPLGGTVAATFMEHGTGALNIDGCRIGTTVETWPESRTWGRPPVPTDCSTGSPGSTGSPPPGRWPANVLLDADAAEVLDEQAGAVTRNGGGRQIWGARNTNGPVPDSGYADSGGPSRFFYTAKASRSERDAGLDDFDARAAGEATGRKDGSAGLTPRAGAGRATRTGVRNTHPTVKPVDLMRWLVRLVCPPGGIVLDPFAGSGTTGVATMLEGSGRRFIGLELDPLHVDAIGGTP